MVQNELIFVGGDTRKPQENFKMTKNRVFWPFLAIFGTRFPVIDPFPRNIREKWGQKKGTF